MEFNFYKIKNIDENIYISLAKNNKEHWWYKSRRKILYKIFSSERFFLNKFNFPLGVSLILIGEKEK